jgi:hypothetical protein
LGGRPQIETALRALIWRINVENPLWGAPRIHGELLKLGLAVAQSSIAKYMIKRRGPPSLALGYIDMRNYVDRRIMRSPGRFTLHWLELLGCSTPHNFRPHLSLSIASAIKRECRRCRATSD